jgi:hypothetical protein
VPLNDDSWLQGAEDIVYNISYIYPMNTVIEMRSIIIDDAQEDPNAALHVQITVTNARVKMP